MWISAIRASGGPRLWFNSSQRSASESCRANGLPLADPVKRRRLVSRQVCHDAPMTAHLKGRYRQVERLLADVVLWAEEQEAVLAVALVGSHARGQARMASDVDIIILTSSFEQYAADSSWFVQLRPGSRLVRSATWGPLLERRFRLRSGAPGGARLGFPRLGGPAARLRHTSCAQRRPPDPLRPAGPSGPRSRGAQRGWEAVITQALT